MLATNFTDARKDFKKYCDEAVKNSETVVVTRKNHENVVILSLDKYNNLRENMYIFGNREYAEQLLESKKQVETGLARNRALIEE